MKNILLLATVALTFASCSKSDDNISSDNFELSNDGRTLVKWTNSNTTTLDMQADGNLQKVNFIGDNAFRMKEALTSITFPKDLYRIGTEAFYATNLSGGVKFNVNSETEVNFGSRVFARTNITTIELPNANGISDEMFDSCQSLKEVKHQRMIRVIGSYAFNNCRSLEYLFFHDSYLTKVEQGAFANCEKLRVVTLPLLVTEIGDVAFANCNALESITINAKTPPTLGEDVFYGVKNIPRIYVFSRDAYINAPGWSKYANRIYSK